MPSKFNLRTHGTGPVTLILAHGFGCDQTMWRFMAPALAQRYRVILFDYVGSGQSDISQYESTKYASLDGYADDLIEVAELAKPGPLVLVGHSVSSMIGLIADQKVPGIFTAHVMIGPSPSYINQDGYVGGFEREDIEELLVTLEGNYLGWASHLAASVMGTPERPELTHELADSFCRMDPDITARFARATFLSNNLDDLSGLAAPTLIIQSTEDAIAPSTVAEHMRDVMQDCTLRYVENTGHCPHMTAPDACIAEIVAFLKALELDSAAA